MDGIENVDDEAVAPGLNGADMQQVARRQLVASIAVAVVVALAAGLTALMPASHTYAQTVPHRLAGVQQPSFVTPAGGQLALEKKTGIELP